MDSMTEGDKLDAVTEGLQKQSKIEEYKRKSKELSARNKESMENNVLKREAKRQLSAEKQKAKEERIKFARDARRGERATLTAKRREQNQTAKALEEEMARTHRQLEEALAKRNVVRSSVAHKERIAEIAQEEMLKATAAKNRIMEQLDAATQKALKARQVVQEAKSLALDKNIEAIRAKLTDQFTQVHDAWQFVNPKKRRRELMNNELRKSVRDLLH